MVVQYLSVARQYEHHTRVEVPKLKHAPINLGRQLEDYLNDPDFEIHRRQYLAEMDAKKQKGGATSSSIPSFKSDSTSKALPSSAFPSVNGSSDASSKPAAPAKGPDADLIDFFDSIEQNQTTLGAPPTAQPPVLASPWGNPGVQPQPTGFQNGFVPQPTGFQSTNPFQQSMGAMPPPQPMPQQQLQPSFTGAGFGGFTSQSGFQSSLAPIPQDSVASFPTGLSMSNLQPQQPQATNPFRASMLMGQPTGMSTQSAPSPPALVPQQTSTNPFARAATLSPPASTSPFQTGPPQAAPLMPMATGTNPFAKNFGAGQQPQRPSTSSGALAAQPTGTTNPFRQSQFVNHNTGMGWQHNQQPIGGGLDSIPTVPVFPRPASQSPWQQ